MLLEKCKTLGMRPADVLNLSAGEDTFLNYAIQKKYER